MPGSKTKFLTVLSGWREEKKNKKRRAKKSKMLINSCSLPDGTSVKNAINALGRQCLFSDLHPHLLICILQLSSGLLSALVAAEKKEKKHCDNVTLAS